VILPRNPEGKVVVFHRVTGERFERWPVDAREMIQMGEYRVTPPTETAEAVVTNEATAVIPPIAATTPASLPTEIAPGVPAVYTHSRDASPAQLIGEPARTKKGK
jgi:hypothetical protein